MHPSFPAPWQPLASSRLLAAQMTEIHAGSTSVAKRWIHAAALALCLVTLVCLLVLPRDWITSISYIKIAEHWTAD